MLHIISQTPELSLLQRIAEGDDVLFIDKAVYILCKHTFFANTLVQILDNSRLYTLQDDLTLRGLASDQLLTGIEVVDYQGFVKLTLANEAIMSWT